LRHRIAFAALIPLAVALTGIGTAQAAPPTSGPANHGQCVSESPRPDGPGGRSATAKSKSTCTLPLTCVENEGGEDTVVRDSRANTVTIAGSGPGSAGSSLECTTNIRVEAGDTVSFTYALGSNTVPCGGGVPRMFVIVDGDPYETINWDPECSQANGNTVTYTLPEGGTVTQVGFVYDRGDFGSITYSDATVGGVALNI
jgi:hypothetical protein